jgi:drug/metabolite transporter (DMT)-like permease
MPVHVVLFLVAFLWGINPPVMKVGLLYIDPQPYNAVRMVLAAMAGWIILRPLGQWRPLRHQDRFSFIIAGVGFFLFQICYTAGVQKTTAGNSALVMACLPISVIMINYWHKRERAVDRKTILGIIFSFIGVTVMVAGTEQQFNITGNHVIGTLLLLAAQVNYGYYTVFSGALTKTYSPYQITAYVLLFSTGLLLCISIPSVLNTNWQMVPWAGWASIIYSGLFPLCLGNCLWIWGTGVLGSTKASLYNNLPPLFAVTTGCIFLNESFGVLQLLGAVLIFGGLYLTNKRSRIKNSPKINDK